MVGNLWKHTNFFLGFWFWRLDVLLHLNFSIVNDILYYIPITFDDQCRLIKIEGETLFEI